MESKRLKKKEKEKTRERRGLAKGWAEGNKGRSGEVEEEKWKDKKK